MASEFYQVTQTRLCFLVCSAAHSHGLLVGTLAWTTHKGAPARELVFKELIFIRVFSDNHLVLGFGPGSGQIGRQMALLCQWGGLAFGLLALSRLLALLN